VTVKKNLYALTLPVIGKDILHGLLGANKAAAKKLFRAKLLTN
jgi:hypothetical protein